MKLKNNFPIILILTLLPLLVHSTLFSQQVENNIINLNSETDTLRVEDGIIHLGDNEGNQGITFSKVFTLSDSQYSRLQYARLYIDFIPDYGPYYEDPPKLFINDSPHGSIAPFFPPLGVGCWNYWSNGTHDYCGFMRVDLKISRTVLTSGNNIFRIDNGQPDDDYRFTRVMVVLFYSAILNPKGGDLWIAGEQDTIRWEGLNSGVSLIIQYSSNSGTDWQMIASGVSADDKKYAWDIPNDILSTKCLVRIKDYSSGDTLGVSDTFKIKPYILTRIHSTTGDFIPYVITNDRWGFANDSTDVWPSSWYKRFDYKGIDPFTGKQYSQTQQILGTAVFARAKPSDFPDWVSWVHTFTEPACYFDKSMSIYSNLALERWKGAKDEWNGSCFGIAGSNALAFRFRDRFYDKFPYLPHFADPVTVWADESMITIVSEIFSHQFGNPTKNGREHYDPKPTQTLQDIRQILRQDESTIRTLSMWYQGPNGGGHNVLPYKLERVSNTSPLWNVFVYDNNEPDDINAKIVIDTSANGNHGWWGYSNLNWSGSKLIQLEEPSEVYFGNATLAKSQRAQSPFILNSGMLEINNTKDAFIQIKDEIGNISGFKNDTVSRGIPGCVPLIVTNGRNTPPYGYALHAGNYSVTLDSFKNTESRAFFFTGNKTFGFERLDTEPFQTDNLHFDTTTSPRLAIANPDPQSKSVTLMNILNETTQEKTYIVNSLALSQNDSIAMKNLDEDKLKLVGYGSAKHYDLRLEYASAAKLRVFGKSNISLTSNTTHIIEPQWDNLRDSLLTILVDVGNDGTIDDTLKLQNELTGIHDHGSLIPSEYKLYQNYPNPFNPITTISYQLPTQSHVTLKVFDVLGREVATLVDEYKEVGYYEASFDASSLSGGVYYYRLQAGTFTETKKLLLMK